jgi:hypothetical protein
MESRGIQAAERNRKVDEEFHKTDTSLLIGPFYVFRVGDKKAFRRYSTMHDDDGGH